MVLGASVIMVLYVNWAILLFSSVGTVCGY